MTRQVPASSRADGQAGTTETVATEPGTTEAVIRELAEEDLPAVVRLCGEALDLPEDASEATAIVGRLRSVPPGHRTVALVADSGGELAGVVLASLRRDDPTAGHIDLVAVHPRRRRRGIGRALLVEAEAALAAAGAREVQISGNLPYAWPGIDVRYTPAICAALGLGYQQHRTAWNMTVDLSTPEATKLLETSTAERALAGRGVLVRRATAGDLPALTRLIESSFGNGWIWEAGQSIGRDGAGCHIAVRAQVEAETETEAASSAGAEGGPAEEVLGFAAWGALRPTWFGPMGTAPGARGSGIGEVLLRRCLADQRAAGHARVQIGWAGPVAFYSRAVGAYIERVFLLFRKEL